MPKPSSASGKSGGARPGKVKAARPAPGSLDDFAARVHKGAAATDADGRFGPKAFISHVRARTLDDPVLGKLSDREFKARLVAAHQAGALELSRADLVESMNPAVVRASNTPYLNANYHFVRLRKG